MPVPDCFDYSGLVIQFASGIVIPSTLFFLEIAAAIQGRLWLHIHFWNVKQNLFNHHCSTQHKQAQLVQAGEVKICGGEISNFEYLTPGEAI